VLLDETAIYTFNETDHVIYQQRIVLRAFCIKKRNGIAILP